MAGSSTLSTKVQGLFYAKFYKWGLFVARRPRLVILLSLFLGFACMARLFMGDLPTEIEALNLWVPPDSQAKSDQKKYDAIFETSARRNEVYFTTKPQGGNVLNNITFSEMLRFDTHIKDALFATTLSGRGSDGFTELELASPADYEDVCYRGTTQAYNSSACLQFGNPLGLFRAGDGYDFDLSDQQVIDLINYQRELKSETGKGFDAEGAFGGIEYDGEGRIISAKAVLLTYETNVDDEGEPINDASEAFEDQMNYMIGPDWTLDPPLSEGSAWSEAGEVGPASFRSSFVDIYPETASAISVQFGEAISGDVSALTIGIMLIIAYAVLVLAKFHRVKSRSLLALAGVASCGIAIGVSYGLTTAFGVPLNPVVNVLPFVLIGIGVDDMFVLVNALESTPSDMPGSERIARTLASAGVSVTVTSFTDMFAFALGTTSSLPALRDFCIFAVFGILGDYFFQLTFFAGWLALDVLREESKRVDCFFCLKSKNADEKPACCCLPGCGACGRKIAAPPGGRLRYLIDHYYLPLLRPDWAKWVVIGVFFSYAAFSAWAASNLEQNFKQRWFVPSGAKLQETFDIEDKWFSTRGPPVWTVTSSSSDWAYATVSNQRKYEQLEDAIKESKWIIDESVSSWYPAYKLWIWQCGNELSVAGCAAPDGNSTCIKRSCLEPSGSLCFPECSYAKVQRTPSGEPLRDVNGVLYYGESDPKYAVDAQGVQLPDGSPFNDVYVPPSKFYAWLDQFVSDTPAGLAVSSFIRWNSDSIVRSAPQVALGLKGARVRAEYLYLDKAVDEVDSMQDLRKSVEALEIGPDGFAFPFMFPYLFYEQFAIIVQEAMLNLCLALVAVAIITFLTMGDVRTTIFVLGCVLLTDIDILGLMWLWGLTIDSVSIINLVLAIGLSVDYSAHVAHAFLTATGTKQQRMEKAISEMGVAVIHGAFSTFLAVLVLSRADSYVFRIFFKQFFSICVFGVSHGLVFLPAVLGLFGPQALTQSQTTHPGNAPASKALPGKSMDGQEMAVVTESPPASEIAVSA